MSRTPLSFYCSYYIDTKVDPAAVTNYGGIFPYLDLMLLVDLPRLVSKRLPKKGMRGWQHAEHVAALLALNLTGGDCVDDLVKLDGDPGIGLYMGQIARSVGAQDRRFSRGGDSRHPIAYIGAGMARAVPQRGRRREAWLCIRPLSPRRTKLFPACEE